MPSSSSSSSSDIEYVSLRGHLVSGSDERGTRETSRSPIRVEIVTPFPSGWNRSIVVLPTR